MSSMGRRTVHGEALGELVEFVSGEVVGVGHVVEHDRGVWRDTIVTRP